MSASSSGRALGAWLFVSLLATSGVAHAFRTASDLPELAGSGVVRWDRDLVEYRVDLEGLRGVSFTAVERAVREGLGVWEEAGCSSLRFVQVGGGSSPESGDSFNDIGFVRESWVRAGFPAEAVGATDVLYREQPDGSWQIVEADVWLNAWDYDWTTGADNVAAGIHAVQPAIAHEAGHMLGLLHSNEGAPIMAPFYASDATTLRDDDLAGVCFLYPAASSCSGCPRGSTCEEGRCDVPCGGECSPDECVDDACVPVACEGEECGSGRQFGDACAVGEDCESGLCLTSASGGTCTVECGVCPEDGACESVAGREVCVARSSSGCTTTGASGLSCWLLLALARRKR